MRWICQVYAVARFRKLYLFWYAPQSLMPLLLLFVFWRLGGGELSQHILVGWMVALAISSGVSTLPQSVLFYKVLKMQDMVVASPIHPFTYMMGTGVRSLLYALPGWALILSVMVGVWTLAPALIPRVLVLLLLTWLVSCVIGFALASHVESIAIITPVSNLVAMGLTLLPPVYYPIEFIPVGYRWITYVFPTTHVAQLIKGAMGMVELSSRDSMLHWGVAVLFTLALLLYMAQRLQWRET
ncbi:ABC transporter permease [Dehalococcoidia bacterium]|nr:ABC transporter permease [Dehalococcoidia bacterium]